MSNTPPKVALLHEWFDSYAGSERVVEQMLEVFPQADLFALCDFLKPEDREFLKGREVTTSFMQRLPFAKRTFRGFLPLMPLAVEQFCFDPFDVVLSSSHCVAHGALTRADQLHISYVHSPIRYAWDLQHQYLRESGLSWGIRSMIVRMILHYMRLWDRTAADRVDHYVANSHYVAKRVQKTYRRPCEVIYPPVDVEAFPLQTEKQDYFLTASRLVPYKRVDIVVEAFQKLPKQRLVVVGDGPDMEKIKRLAGSNVECVGYQSHAELRQWMQGARAFVFAADEDFGITPVEAQACGTPCIAYGVGGSLETIARGETGLHFQQQTADSVVDAIERFVKDPNRFEPERIRQHAEQFSASRFQQQMQAFVHDRWQDHQRSMSRS